MMTGFDAGMNPSAAPATSQGTKRRSMPWRSAAVVVLVLGIMGGVGLWFAAGAREDGAIRDLARAPFGCDTTLDFDVTGEFLLFVETRGRFDETPRGDCDPDTSYDSTEQDVPPIVVSLTDSSGDDVALDSRAGVRYSNDTFSGSSVRSVEIVDPGAHVLRVEAADGGTGFAVAVGRDPSAGVATMRLGSVFAGVAGLLLAGLLWLVSRKRTREVLAVSTPGGFGPQTGWATSPPGMPQPPRSPSGGFPIGPPIQPVSPPALWFPTEWSQSPQPRSPQPQPQPPVPHSPTPPLPAQWPGGVGLPAPRPRAAEQDVVGGGATGDGERSPWGPPMPPMPPSRPDR